MRTPLVQAITFCVLFTAAHFVNKYVLSVLNFQFPTIFQGWQTLVGFLMLSLLIASKHLPTLMEDVTRSDVAHWLPGMMFFVCSIYSGSKALAKLSMPVYLSLHNLITVIYCTGQLAIYRQLTSLFSYTMMMILVLSSICVGTTDPDFVTEGYFWMCVHIVSSGAVGIYTKLIRGRLKLSAHETLYCNYLYSVIVLAPSSYFLGDAIEAGKYPQLYYSEFFMGCLMSGVFGVLLSLCTIKIMENTKSDKAEFAKIFGIAKLLTSLLSLWFFNSTLTANNLIWISINHLAAIVCEDSTAIEDTSILPTSATSQQPQILTRQNSHTHEYIRTSVE